MSDDKKVCTGVPVPDKVVRDFWVTKNTFAILTVVAIIDVPTWYPTGTRRRRRRQLGRQDVRFCPSGRAAFFFFGDGRPTCGQSSGAMKFHKWKFDRWTKCFCFFLFHIHDNGILWAVIFSQRARAPHNILQCVCTFACMYVFIRART